MIRRVHRYNLSVVPTQPGDLIFSPKDVAVLLEHLENLFPAEDVQYALAPERRSRYPRSAALAAMHQHIQNWIRNPDDWIHPSTYTFDAPLGGRIDPR